MKTIVTKDPEIAARYVRRGGIVAFPTETVYGLGANAFDAEAIGKIFVAKQRPDDNPLIAHVATLEQIGDLAAEITENAAVFIERFFPGPLTIVIKKSPAVPDIATAGLDSIGVRMPGSELAHRFIEACGTPVVAPSANLSGRPSPTTFEAVFEDLDGRIDCILKGEPTQIGLESTVVDCTEADPVLLRAGAVSLAELQAVVPETRTVDRIVGNIARSPGMRHRHYSPRARVIISGDAAPDPKSSAYIGLTPPESGYSLCRRCSDLADYARSLFEFFRECDRRGIENIVCEPVAEDGIGSALMDRLRRASEL